MFAGLDGVEIGLIIVFLCLFGGILSGFPVAFAIGGAGVISFAIIAALDSSGYLIHQAIDTGSAQYAALIADGIKEEAISIFRYPELPRVESALFPQGWEVAMDRNISFVVNRMNERVLAGQSIETLLAVLMFVLMGITLERSRIANELLTTMARVFGPLPGGLAVSVVVVGAFLAASTGIVGATVVTMGLLSLPTMLRNNYSPRLATGVIAASGTLGQIIPPSIVIVLLGTLAGDLYATAQENRAQAAGCSDALTYLGEPAVVSVGTLFQAAMLPGIMLACLYAAYAFGFAMLNPHQAPAVRSGNAGGEYVGRQHALRWFVLAPGLLIGGFLIMSSYNVIGPQSFDPDQRTQEVQESILRTNVGEECAASMIELHGQEAWDRAVEQRKMIDAAGGVAQPEALDDARRAELIKEYMASAAPVGTGLAVTLLFFALVLAFARGVAPSQSITPLVIGGIGIILAIVVDVLLVAPLGSNLVALTYLAAPLALALLGISSAARMLASNELLRVVFPPLVLIVAVLGSILGGITNPTPAAALGAAGAIMLAAYRKLVEDGGSGKVIVGAAFAVVIMILLGLNFDLRVGHSDVDAESWVAFVLAQAAYIYAIVGLLYSCCVLLWQGVLTPVVRETAKVTSMVFTILIGSQLLNLVVISFGGEHYIQSFLKSYDSEFQVFLIVMLVLFVLGFVLDFLEIIYIVVPIVGPVIYGGTFDPSWVTIMIAVNLQTSFLTPPFGFALFYLRGVAPRSVTTSHIYRGVIPFVIIQVVGLTLLWLFPGIVTLVPDLIGH